MLLAYWQNPTFEKLVAHMLVSYTIYTFDKPDTINQTIF